MLPSIFSVFLDLLTDGLETPIMLNTCGFKIMLVHILDLIVLGRSVLSFQVFLIVPSVTFLNRYLLNDFFCSSLWWILLRPLYVFLWHGCRSKWYDVFLELMFWLSFVIGVSQPLADSPDGLDVVELEVCYYAALWDLYLVPALKISCG